MHTTTTKSLRDGVMWPVTIFLAIIHVAAIGLCSAFPSWEGLVVGLILYPATGIGVTIGYHRMLTHESFQACRPMQYVFTLLGMLAGEGPPIFWVAVHRQHHKHSDQEGDPHSPIHGWWWSHVLWLCSLENRRDLTKIYTRWAPKLVRDPFLLFVQKTYIFWHIGQALALFGLGYWWGGSYLGWSVLGYGFFARMVVVLHTTWLVNSATHTWGYRNYPDSGDQSTNHWLVALLTWGEGWHNNHHGSQLAANHGFHRWWEFDLTFVILLLLAVISYPLRWVGLPRWRLVYGLKVYRPSQSRIVTWFP